MTRILIVDDEKAVATALKEGFKRHTKEFKTDVAFSAEGAFELIEKHLYSVVVSDIRLPGKSGLDVFLKLRDEQPDAAFIAMTAFSNPAVERQVREMGGLKYLEKPFEFEELESLVLEKIRASAEDDAGSLLQSLELSSVAQLINMERKTLVLEISSAGRTGYLDFRKGELVDASFRKLKGEKAAITMFSLQQYNLKVKAAKRGGKKTIKLPLMNLLMNAMKEEDERFLKEKNIPLGADFPAPVDVEMLEENLKIPLKELGDVKGFVSVGIYDEAGTFLAGKGMEGETALVTVERDLDHLLEQSAAAFSVGEVGTVHSVVVNFSLGTLMGERVSTNGELLHLMAHIDENGNLTMARKAMDGVVAALMQWGSK